MSLAYCIPTFNSFERCEEAIRSVMRSSLKPDALIIIDDSGTGASLTRLVPVLAEYHNAGQTVLLWVHERRCGVATSWNQFMRDTAAYDRVIIANDDVFVHPDTIQRMMIAADEQPDEVFFAGDGHSGNTFSFFLLTRKGYDEIGPFDERFFPAYFEDNDYSRRITLAGYKHVMVDGAIYDHIGSSTLKSYSREEEQLHHQQFRANEDYYKYKWGGPPHKELYHLPFNGVHE